MMNIPSFEDLKERVSFQGLKERVSKIGAKKLGLFALAASTLVDGGPVYNYASYNKFTLKSTMGKVADKTEPSGLYFYLPLMQYTHDYNKQVQTIDFSVGGQYLLPFGESTSDRNHLGAKVKLNYRVTEDTQKLGMHAWEMDGFIMQDGFWLLTKMMNKSANTVMGKRTMAETMGNPARFTEEFYEDLNFRLEENNVPVEVESIEFQKFRTIFPTQTISGQKVVNPNRIEPKILINMMQKSANTIISQHTAAEVVQNPHTINEEFREDITANLIENNLPIQIENVELKQVDSLKRSEPKIR